MTAFDNQDLLDRLLLQGLEEGVYPSAAAAVGVGGHAPVMKCVGVTDQNGGTPVNRFTRYDMASITKILSPTMIALRAMEEGELTLDDTVGRFFDAPEDKKSITVRMLMTHTGGFEPAFSLKEEAKDGDVVRAILAHPLAGMPGDRPRYSCMGYILLGRMLEEMTGKRLDALAEERVFRPMGMNRTSYLPEGGNIASTELSPVTGRVWNGIVHDENARFLGGVSGNAGVFSDLTDMTQFVSMLAQGGNGFLAPATLRAAIRCRTEGQDARRGLGFHLGGTPENFMGDLFPPDSFGHTGFTGTSFAVDPRTGFYVVLLTNRVHPTRNNQRLTRFRRTLHNALYADFSRTAGIC